MDLTFVLVRGVLAYRGRVTVTCFPGQAVRRQSLILVASASVASGTNTIVKVAPVGPDDSQLSATTAVLRQEPVLSYLASLTLMYQSGSGPFS